MWESNNFVSWNIYENENNWIYIITYNLMGRLSEKCYVDIKHVWYAEKTGMIIIVIYEDNWSFLLKDICVQILFIVMNEWYHFYHLTV